MYDWIIDALYPFVAFNIVICIPTILLGFVGYEAFASTVWFFVTLALLVMNAGETNPAYYLTEFVLIDFFIGAGFQAYVWSHVQESKPVGRYKQYW